MSMIEDNVPKYYLLKNLKVIDSIAKINNNYEKVCFFLFKWKNSRVHNSIVIKQPIKSIIESIINNHFYTLDKSNNLSEQIFNFIKEYQDLVLATSDRIQIKDNNADLNSKVLLGKYLSIPSDEIFEIYKSCCIFNEIGDPSRIGIHMSCDIRGRKKGICLDESLLVFKTMIEDYNRERVDAER